MNKKFIRKFFTVFGAMLSLLVLSCGGVDSSRASFSFLVSRDVVSDNQDTLFIVVELRGDFNASQVLPVEIDKETTVAFEEIPVESKITARAAVYFETDYEGEKLKINLFEGVSEPVVIQEGENQVSLTLKRIEGSYTVKHLLQNIGDDDYTEDEENSRTLNGKTGEKTIAEAKEYTGFETGVFEQEPIKSDGTTVIKIKYNRKVYTLTYSIDGTEQTSPLRYGAKIEKSKDPKKEDSGLISYHFDGWFTSEDGGTTLSEAPYDFETPVTSDVTLYAKWSEILPGTAVFEIVLPETDESDISVTVKVGSAGQEETAVENKSFTLNSGESIIFAAETGYASYVWKINGTEKQSDEGSPNMLTITESDLLATSVNDIVLLAQKTDGAATLYHSYTAQIKKVQ